MRIKIVIGANTSRAAMLFAIFALTGCEPSELNPAGGVPFMGGGNSGSYTAPVQTPAKKLAPMLQDPEAESVETSEEVWADNEADAAQKCQQIAEIRTREGRTVVTVQDRPQLVFKGRFVCSFRGEK